MYTLWFYLHITHEAEKGVAVKEAKRLRGFSQGPPQKYNQKQFMVLKDEHVSFISIDYRCLCYKNVKGIRMKRRESFVSCLPQSYRNMVVGVGDGGRYVSPFFPLKRFGIPSVPKFGKNSQQSEDRVHFSPNRNPGERWNIVERAAGQMSRVWPRPDPSTHHWINLG